MREHHERADAASGAAPSAPDQAHSPEEYVAALRVIGGSPTPRETAAIAAALSVAERERHRWLRRRAEQHHEPVPAWRAGGAPRPDRLLY